MDKTNRVPLFYEEYPGSVNDISQFTFMVDKVIEYDYKKIGFILDRGYFSKENIRYMDENDYSFIIMCKGCKALVSSLVLSKQGSF
jgi:transposase